MSDRPGEILVTFYTQELRSDDSTDEDEDDDEEDPEEEKLRAFGHVGGRSLGEYIDEDEFGDFPRSKTAPAYFAIPLQYMCKVKRVESKDELPVRLVMDFDKIPLRPRLETSGKLRIM